MENRKRLKAKKEKEEATEIEDIHKKVGYREIKKCSRLYCI
jgi:hypothetical protein